jgi:signal peptidase II
MKRKLQALGWAAVVCVGLDQATKQWAVQSLKGLPMTSYLGDVFRLQYAENSGAFLSLGAGLSSSARFWLLSVSVFGLLAVATAFLMKARDLKGYQELCLAAAITGGFSNWIDRVFRTEGRVVDFLNVGVGNLRTGIFNIADMGILFGIIIFVLTTRNSSPPEAQ